MPGIGLYRNRKSFMDIEQEYEQSALNGFRSVRPDSKTVNEKDTGLGGVVRSGLSGVLSGIKLGGFLGKGIASTTAGATADSIAAGAQTGGLWGAGIGAFVGIASAFF